MKINQIARKYFNRLTAEKDKLFSYPVEQQKRFLSSLPTPLDDYIRSKNQYLAQAELNGKWRTFCLNIICFFIYFRQKAQATKQHFKLFEKKDMVFHIYGADRTLIPQSLFEEFPNYCFSESDDMYLLNEDILFLKKAQKQTGLSYYFFAKVLTKIALYRAIIEKYQPKAIVTCSEYSFTSSLLTLWLEEQGIEHVNFMHGEKLFYMRDSFARFSRFYVWDQYYCSLLKKLYFPQESIIVETPSGLLQKQKNHDDRKFDFKYYLANESPNELKVVLDTMLFLNEKKKRVKIRPHPRYTNLSYLLEHCDLELIEQNKSLEQSLEETQFAVSLYSTVLQQAYAKGLTIVIDDLKNEQKYQKLIELDYVILKRPHMLLSDILNELKNIK